ncbi:general substrate transporter [Violaceomyces palustris]|uniref:General substrate transporter n=1 Tax=Violaceomyces palustris TaxID=1673888 RepID=A0ACD0NXD2_9BASI|nr:general substrate transporter [Violaceomyces palustris]
MVYQLPVMFGGNRLKGSALTAAVAFVSGVGFLLFGYDQGVMSGLLTENQMAAQFPKIASTEDGGGNVDSSVQGAVVAIYEIGALFGSLFVLWKGDTVGRRTSIFLGSIIMTVGSVIMTASYGLGQFTVGRIITGIGNGMNTSTIPMWQSELSKAHNRGLLVLIEGALIAGGIMISYWVDYGFYQIKNSSVQWRFPIAFQAAFAIILFFGILALPESPRWLIKKGYKEEAAKVLAQLDATTVDDPEVVTVVRQLEESIVASEQLMGEFSYKELFTNGPEQNFYRTSIAFVAQAFQQLSGINLITYYATTVFKSIQDDDTTARLLAAGNGTEYFIASLFALFMIDTLGRRNLMMSTAFMMSASMAILAGTTYVVNKAPKGSSPPEAYVAAVFLYFFNTMFAFGWLGMTWLYPPEITAIRIRAPASAIATSSNWLFNFLIVMITPPAFASIGYQTYIIFAVLNMSFIPVIWAFFPETKRRGLEEMDLIFAESHEGQWWKASRFMTTACYLSLTKKSLTSEELDAELSSRFGNSAKRAALEGGDEKKIQGSPAQGSEADKDEVNQFRDSASSHSGTRE